MLGASQHKIKAPATHEHTTLADAHAALEESWTGGGEAAAEEEVEEEEEGGGEAEANDNNEDVDGCKDCESDSDNSDDSTWAVAAQAAAASAAVGAAMAAASAAAAAAAAAMAAAQPGPLSRELVERDLTRASASAAAAARTALAAHPTCACATRACACTCTCGANRASGEHSGVNPNGVTSAFMSLYDIANQAASAGGHMAMEIGTTTSAPQACTGPPAGAPPPPGATQISQRGVYPSAYPVAYPTAYPDEIPLAEASVVWQSFSPDGFGEIAPGYALAPAPPKGRKRKQSAGRRDAHGNQLVYASYSPLSIEEAWRDHHQRVTSARQQAEAEGLVLQRSAQSASGYKGVAINKLPHGEKDRPRPYQGYVVRAEKKMHLGSFSVPEEAALAVARELAAEAAWAAQYPSAAMTVARSTPAPPPAPQSAPTPLPPPLAPGTKVAIRGLTGRREMNGRTGVILHWLEDFERWVVAIDGDDDETDTEIKRPPLVTVGSQFATPLDALPLVFSTTIADGEAPPGTAEAAGSGSDVDIATVEGVAIATVESEREESRRMRVKPRNVCHTGLEPRTSGPQCRQVSYSYMQTLPRTARTARQRRQVDHQRMDWQQDAEWPPAVEQDATCGPAAAGCCWRRRGHGRRRPSPIRRCGRAGRHCGAQRGGPRGTRCGRARGGRAPV